MQRSCESPPRGVEDDLNLNYYENVAIWCVFGVCEHAKGTNKIY